jgi:hypothetical protein
LISENEKMIEQALDYLSGTSAPSALALAAMVATLGVTAGHFIRRGRAMMRPRRPVRQPARQGVDPGVPRPDQRPDKRVESLAVCTVAAVPLHDLEAARLHRDLSDLVRGMGDGFTVLTQVPMRAAFRVEQAPGPGHARAAADLWDRKRVDFLIVDDCGQPLCGIEYRGDPARSEEARRRDEVRRRVFTAAGIPLLEVRREYNWRFEGNRVRRVLQAVSQRRDAGAEEPRLFGLMRAG